MGGSVHDEVWHLSNGWRFGGEYRPGSEAVDFDDTDFVTVSVPHCVAPLGWRDWDPADWERVWVYRRKVELPGTLAGRRWLLELDGVLSACTVWWNGLQLARHAGGYLPLRVDIGGHARPGENCLVVVVDGRWQNVPPQGRPGGAPYIDFFEPAGIYRDVTLRSVPESCIDELFVAGQDVLGPDRRLEVTCSPRGLERLGGPVSLRATVGHGQRVISQTSVELGPSRGDAPARVTVGGLDELVLWDLESPRRYDCRVELVSAGTVVHAVSAVFGLREARFETDGFFLNGRRVQLRGLNRHQLFPYQGMAMPRRAQRRDAEILKNELHCNVVRCSHYPQSPHFLDACDELGLLVWEEVPGWGYIGDEAWRDALLRDVAGMVRRDRNRPSVVIWGVRANESPNDPELYQRAKQIAQQLDGTRATSGSMVYYTTENWGQDVFAFDDYRTLEDGIPSLKEPLPGVPYLVSEAVGALSGHRYYRREDPQQVQQDQAFLHARVLDKAASDDRYAGLIGWCGIDYASVNGNTYRHLKWPGVLDTFRERKPGATIYRSQLAPALEVIIEPAFYWYFGDGCSVSDLDAAMICSNCEELRILVAGREHARVLPDRQRFASLEWPPFFVDLSQVAGDAGPELEIEGYVDGKLVGRRRFAADTGTDRLEVAADDAAIVADGVDVTRVAVRVTDCYGALRPRAEGTVDLSVQGPGELIGEPSFDLRDGGPLRSVWLRGRDAEPGTIRLRAVHARYQPAQAKVQAKAGPAGL